MAVEATHIILFHPQFLGKREMMNPIEANGNMFQTQMGYGGSTTSAIEGLMLPLYNSLVSHAIHQKAAKAQEIKPESSLTYNNLTLPRKRSRDSINPILSFPSPEKPHKTNNKTCFSFSFHGHDIDISLHMELQQLEIDQLISQHMEKMRVEMEEKKKMQARRMMEAIEEAVMKKVRAKEEEIEKIGKLNWALEERAKSLCVENQIWRDLARTNEATPNALRTNIEQVLEARVKDERTRGVGLEEAAGDEVDDAQSCCGISREAERRRLAAEGGSRVRECRNCGKEESCVLVLPCRHLCLCTVCGSSLHICPICKSTKNASFLVNMS